MKVIKNEQHKLLNSQRDIIMSRWDKMEIFPVPANGWGKDDIISIAEQLALDGDDVIFVSPVPLLLAKLVKKNMNNIFVFFNSHREKKELPNGKIIFTVPTDGWELVKI